MYFRVRIHEPSSGCQLEPLRLTPPLTGINENRFQLYVHQTLLYFPRSPETYCKSLTARVIQRVVAGLAFLDNALPANDAVTVRQLQTRLGYFMMVLPALSSIDVDAMWAAQSEALKTKRSPLLHLQGHKCEAGRPITEDSQLESGITSLGHRIPDSTKQWHLLSEDLLSELKDICRVTLFANNVTVSC
jgi:hypothetical protein